MARVEAVIAGTGVIPSYGAPLLDESDLQKLAAQFNGRYVPMMREHDLDQPIEIEVVSSQVRDGPNGTRELFVVFDVPDPTAAEFETARGMSISFTRTLFGPDSSPADCALWVDPNHFSRHELAVAAQRLNAAGFTPEGGVYIQLSELPPPVVVFEFVDQLVRQLGWAVVTTAIIEGLRVLIRRDRKGRYRFVVRSGKDIVTAEIETSNERALAEAIRGLRDLSLESGGMFVREPGKKRWRAAGQGKPRRRNTKKRKGS